MEGFPWVKYLQKKPTGFLLEGKIYLKREPENNWKFVQSRLSEVCSQEAKLFGRGGVHLDIPKLEKQRHSPNMLCKVAEK